MKPTPKRPRPDEAVVEGGNARRKPTPKRLTPNEAVAEEAHAQVCRHKKEADAKEAEAR
jgi:hypothetical protein